MNRASWLVSAGRPELPGQPHNVAPVLVSSFLHGREHEYARDHGTLGWTALEEIVGGLEDAHAVAFASGMAAVTAVFGQVPAGGRVVLPTDCYQGVVKLAEIGEAHGRWSATRLAPEDTPAWVEAAAGADLVWLESVSNPLLTVADVKAIGAAPRKPGALLAVDNTMPTALNLRPLELGADLCVQSATKVIGGHSDLLMGVVTTKDASIRTRLEEERQLAGATPGGLETFLAARGARTLALRLAKAERSATVLAERLEAHPLIERTRHPSLASHPTHEIARRTLRGYGTIISFDMGGGAEEAEALCGGLRLIRRATSFGAVESTIERRAAVPGQEHLPPGLLRLSVGIEDTDDLWADLEAGLRVAASIPKAPQ